MLLSHNNADADTQERIQHMVDHSIIQPLCDLLAYEKGRNIIALALYGLEKILRVRRSMGRAEGVGQI